jgi:rhodanese-related sulfurtransferase
VEVHVERFILRVLVLVLLGTTIGGFAASCSHVMLHLPDQQPQANGQQAPKQRANPDGPRGSTAAPEVAVAPAGATGSTGAAAPTGAPASTGAATGTTTPVATTQPEPQKESNPWFISLEEAKALHDKGVIFIDARTYVEFTEGHIAGAMHCDKKYFDGAAPKKVRDYLPGQEVVVYCHGAECTDSEAVVKRLIALNLGIGPYHIIKDGFPGWQEKNKVDPQGYPIDQGGEVGFQ